jgi:CheY-like chemotaxis protein
MGDAKKILVVDDNPTIMKLLERRLSGEGYKVSTACNGQQGLALAAREVPDLIVSDVDMPLMDGREMAARLKTSIRTNQIPVIFLTALVKDFQSGQTSGEYLYLSKSCKPTELLSAIRNRLTPNV